MSTDRIWDLETNVVVVGAGGAGLVTAINARDGGADVLVLEKMPLVGGIKAVLDEQAAIDYLTATQGGRVNQSLIETFARGMKEIPGYLKALADAVGASVERIDEGHSGIYDFPGRETIVSLRVADIPGFSGYDWTYTGKNLYGQRFFKVLLDNAERRGGPTPWTNRQSSDFASGRPVCLERRQPRGNRTRLDQTL
jgi:hypothetical protein